MTRPSLPLIACLALAAVPGGAGAQAPPVAPPTQSPRPAAAFDDYREGAGRLVDGVWSIRLTAHEVDWRPRGDDGPALPAFAFSADDGPPQAPAPMIRVAAGTPVEVTLTNELGRPLMLFGLTEPPAEDAADSPIPPRLRQELLRLEPGETGAHRFVTETTGSFYYMGWVEEEMGMNAPLVGPLVVDPADSPPPPDEQVMLLTAWGDPSDLTTRDVTLKTMINGRSWPATERLRYTVGDTVRWRVINATMVTSHPMHLHGFYFRVNARGDLAGEVVYPPGERREAVTELLDIDESMRVTWVPDTPGNWLFHCHLVRHMSPLQRLAGEPAVDGHGAGMEDHARDGMAGMIMGITVRPRPGESGADAAVERRLRLFTSRTDGAIGGEPAYSFVVQEGDEPADDSLRVPGSPLVLARGEVTEIVVHNRLGFPFGAHWHGLELPSRFDGVADWSGTPGRTIPPIPPGDSFRVRIQPPRAGTFIYHVHSEPGHQLAQGMYGPLIVLEPGESFDPEGDRILVLASEGTDLDAQTPVINGSPDLGPAEFRAGETYRLRFIHISPDDLKRVRLLRDDEPERWRVVAKDGADLPDAVVRSGAAEIRKLGVGETYDVLWTPDDPGERTLEITTSFYGATGRDPDVARVPVRVLPNPKPTLPAPEDWGRETLALPPHFAPELPLHGTARLRFMPGMFDPAADGYFSYVMTWALPHAPPLDAAALESALVTYFAGIARTFANHAVAVDRFRAELRPSRDGGGRARGFRGSLSAYDPLAAQAPLELNVSVEVRDCLASGRRVVIFQLSPQPVSHPVWAELEAVRSGFRCGHGAG